MDIDADRDGCLGSALVLCVLRGQNPILILLVLTVQTGRAERAKLKRMSAWNCHSLCTFLTNGGVTSDF